MTDRFVRRPTVSRQVATPRANVVSGLFGLATTVVFVACLAWGALWVAGASGVLSFRQLVGLGFGYVTIRAVDLLLVRLSQQDGE